VSWGKAMADIEITGLGALNTDHLHQVKSIIGDGETVVNQSQSSPGGSAANTIYGLAKLGIKAGFTGAVGGDAEGKMIIANFSEVGADTSHISVKAGAKTGSVTCLSDQQGRRSLYVAPGANDLLSEDDIDTGYISRAGMLHISSFVHNRQFRIVLELMGRLEPSTKLSFSPGALYAAKGLKALAPVMNRADVLFINHHELNELTGQDIITGARTCIEQGCSIVGVTLGGGMKLKTGRGGETAAVAYIRHAKREYVIQSAAGDETSPEDTTGAGDAFAAGFLYGLFQKKKPDECGRLGDTMARFSLSRLGTRQGFPTLGQLARCYRQLYSQEL